MRLAIGIPESDQSLSSADFNGTLALQLALFKTRFVVLREVLADVRIGGPTGRWTGRWTDRCYVSPKGSKYLFLFL